METNDEVLEQIFEKKLDDIFRMGRHRIKDRIFSAEMRCLIICSETHYALDRSLDMFMIRTDPAFYKAASSKELSNGP